MTRVLVTGGIRSGKSSFAERLFAPDAPVTYVATGPEPVGTDDEWAQRVRHHQQQRPPTWTSVGTLRVPDTLSAARGPVLVDCLGTWTTGVLDEIGAWDRDDWQPEFRQRCDLLVSSLAHFTGDLVIVSTEVGWGLVSEHRSGRIFTDELGRLNQRVAALADVVTLCVSGLPVAISGRLPEPRSLGAG